MSPMPEPPRVQSPPAPPERADFGSFYQSTLAPLRDYLSRFLSNRTEAQDIAQDAFLKTYQALAVHPIAQPRAFLYATAKNLALNFRERRAARTHPTAPAVFDALQSLVPDPIQRTIADEDDALFASAVAQLPSDLQIILLYRLQRRLSPPQIAHELGLAESTVSNKLGKAMHLVREKVAARNALVLNPPK